MFHILIFLAGCGVLTLGIRHELVWRRKLASHRKTHGTITREVFHDDGGTSAPESEFESEGKTVRFVSKHYYGWRLFTVGKRVVVLEDMNTGEAEELKWSNRWITTFTAIPVGVFFVWASFFG